MRAGVWGSGRYGKTGILAWCQADLGMRGREEPAQGLMWAGAPRQRAGRNNNLHSHPWAPPPRCQSNQRRTTPMACAYMTGHRSHTAAAAAVAVAMVTGCGCHPLGAFWSTATHWDRKKRDQPDNRPPLWRDQPDPRPAPLERPARPPAPLERPARPPAPLERAVLP